MTRPLPTQKVDAQAARTDLMINIILSSARETIADLLDLEKRGMMSDHLGTTTEETLCSHSSTTAHELYGYPTRCPGPQQI